MFYGIFSGIDFWVIDEDINLFEDCFGSVNRNSETLGFTFELLFNIFDELFIVGDLVFPVILLGVIDLESSLCE